MSSIANGATLTRDQVRELDRRAIDEYGVAALVLMENAGRGVAAKLFELGINGPVSIFCGGGNNGGDGFVIARHLDLRKVDLRVVMCADPNALKGDALANYQIIARSGLKIDRFVDVAQGQRAAGSADWIVDALVGTGARGEPRSTLAEAIDAINLAGRPVMAVDIPSGLDCDTGEPAARTVLATHTCTFVAAKPGFFAPGADRYTGQVHVVDIGAPRKLVEEMLDRPAPDR